MKLNRYTIKVRIGACLTSDEETVIVLASCRKEAYQKAKRLTQEQLKPGYKLTGIYKTINDLSIVETDYTFDSSLIILDNLSKEEAKNRIIKYFDLHSPIEVFPSDICEYLKIDFKLGMKIFDELKKERKIK